MPSIGPREALLLALKQEGPMGEEALIQAANRLFHQVPGLQPLQVRGLVDKGFIVDGESIELTSEGETEVEAILSGVGQIENERARILNRTWALSVLTDVGLMAIKLLIGLATGSLALMSDAGDHLVTVLSQGTLRGQGGLRRLMAVAAMMLVAALVLGWVCALAATGSPLLAWTTVTDRPLVMITSSGAAAISLIMFGYHRFAACNSGSLGALSRGNHHRDHAIISLMVVIMTWLSMNDTPILDPLMGMGISLWMAQGAVRLWNEARRLRDGNLIDLGSLIGKADRLWGGEVLVPYRRWLMASLRKGGMASDEAARMLYRTFPNASMPILFQGSGRGLDLEADFGSLIRPMLKSRLLVVSHDVLLLSPNGRKIVRSDLRCRRHMERW